MEKAGDGHLGKGGEGGVRLTNGPPYPPVHCLDHNNRSNIIDLTSTADNTIRLTKLVYSQQIVIGILDAYLCFTSTQYERFLSNY